MSRIRLRLPLLAFSALAAGCQQAPDRQPSAQTTATTAPATAAALPFPEPPLDRAALLLAVIRAASAAAAGEDDRAQQRPLDGKRFELRLRFGCGPASTKQQFPGAGWTFDATRRVLRVKAVPEIDKNYPVVKDVIDDRFEAAEGFRIARPWMLTAACPQPQTAPDPPATGAGQGSSAPPPVVDAAGPQTSPQFIGIAQFFTPADARTHRRNHRAYEVTKTLKDGEEPSDQGYELVISGRLKSTGGERVIICRNPAAETPPDCIISAEFDTVTMERADTSEQLARWSSG